jgi:antitoxin component YwqK of YwqJK toxin-antitoxin module
MTSESYSFQDSLIEITDTELNINLKVKFSPALLPEKLQDKLILGHGHTLSLSYIDQEKKVLHSASMMKDEKHSGQHRSYYSNGEVESESYYFINENDSNSVLHGPSTFFSQEGGILSQVWYLEGKQTGKALSFFPSEKLFSKLRYKDGLPHLCHEYYYENGNIKSSLPYDKGNLHGSCTLYHENGEIFRKIPYVNNEKDGKEEELNSKKEKRAERYFKENTILKEFHWNWKNQLITERIFVDKTTRVNFKKWSENGTLLKMVEHKGDQAFYKQWSNEGELQIEFQGYWDGGKVCLDKVIHGSILPDDASRCFSWEQIEK